jgi:hypothetical protein
MSSEGESSYEEQKTIPTKEFKKPKKKKFEKYIEAENSKGSKVVIEEVIPEIQKVNEFEKQDSVVLPSIEDYQGEKPTLGEVKKMPLMMAEEKPIEIKVPCEKIIARLNIESSCDSRPTGLIEIIKLKGGEKPYEISLNGRVSENGRFDKLYSGEYAIQLLDNENCVTTVFAQVGEQHCEEKIYAFNPEIEEYWQIPNEKELGGTLFLYNKIGDLLVNKELKVINNKWSGLTKSGERVSRGVYLFILKFEDNTVLKGELNVMW